MSDLVSRVLGPIALRGGMGGGSFESTMQIQHHTVPVTLEIDEPGKFDNKLVETIDGVLENLDRVQPMIDEVLRAGFRNDTSAVSQLFEAWKSADAGRQFSTKEEFLARLVPIKLRFSPDIASSHADRMAITYCVGAEPLLGEVKVRFIDRVGAELVP